MSSFIASVDVASAAPSLKVNETKSGQGRLKLTSKTQTVLPNVDDDSGRCALPKGKPFPKFKNVSTCYDGADNKVNGQEDAKDLTLVTLAGIPDVAESASATVSVSATAKDKVRIFIKGDGDKWSEGLKLPAKLTPAQLKSGVTFGVEATDVLRDAKVFDGRFDIIVEVKEGEKISGASRKLQVAKLTAFSTQDVEKIVGINSEGTKPDAEPWPMGAIRASGSKVGYQTRVITGTAHPWNQDMFEGMYASMTQDGKTQHMRVLALAHRNIEGMNEWFGFRGKDVGVIALTGPNGDKSMDAMGNVDGIGSYIKDGKRVATGRLIIGHHDKLEYGKVSQVTRSFFEVNSPLAPIYLDTSFLSVAHVDEIIQVIPAKNERGWAFAVASPKVAMDLLKKVESAKKGSQQLVNPPKHDKFDPPKIGTVSEILKNKDILKANEIAQQRIDSNVNLLKKELGFSDADFVKIPALFRRAYQDELAKKEGGMVDGSKGDPVPFGPRDEPEDPGHGSGGDRPPGTGKATLGKRNLDALVPNAVNALSLDKERLIVPAQHGPKLNGKDVFAEAVTAAHAKNGVKVTFVDTYHEIHVLGGEVHCRTNVFRKIPGEAKS
ncbi:protein-arginine deiminase domain-containing protein [Austwickia sp. TVS 96-490-7B]|uniref:protein-arginine deiminase domain-containing protein n=1 Tax=Austwickia sp. TVS 96-490-7B TaxID=2830843 RepID=UPI001C559C99|nr:protein-arginine deiminase domain-containing protein [Austwickia sp. TVS 96-490-7B]